MIYSFIGIDNGIVNNGYPLVNRELMAGYSWLRLLVLVNGW